MVEHLRKLTLSSWCDIQRSACPTTASRKWRLRLFGVWRSTRRPNSRPSSSCMEKKDQTRNTPGLKFDEHIDVAIGAKVASTVRHRR